MKNLNDFSEVTAGIGRKIFDMNDTLNKKDYLKASSMLHEIQYELSQLQHWVLDANHEEKLRG